MASFCFAVLLCFAVLFGSLSSAFFVANVPYHRQVTDYSCGDASTEMVLHHYYTDVDQRSLIDNMRTTSNDGTIAIDLVRGGHFSSLSPNPSNIYIPFPAQLPVPHQGWNTFRRIGNAAFIHRSNTCWVEDLKQILQTYNAPLIVLMYYDLVPSDGTHYRVFIGFDDTALYFHDPWDRDGQPRVVNYTSAQFCQMWSFAEPSLNGTNLPYTSVVIIPWTINVSFSTNAQGNMTVTANILYPCPFCTVDPDNKKVVAKGVTAELILPPVLSPISPLTQNLGTMVPGDSQVAQWDVWTEEEDGPAIDPSLIRVRVGGVVSGHVPERNGWVNGTYYAAYSYSDEIGGDGSVWF